LQNTGKITIAIAKLGSFKTAYIYYKGNNYTKLSLHEYKH